MQSICSFFRLVCPSFHLFLFIPFILLLSGGSITHCSSYHIKIESMRHVSTVYSFALSASVSREYYNLYFIALLAGCPQCYCGEIRQILYFLPIFLVRKLILVMIVGQESLFTVVKIIHIPKNICLYRIIYSN
jgi:hypothetical protein